MSQLFSLKSVYSDVQTSYDIEASTTDFEDLALKA
jgi:hypothetical protein